MTIYLDSIKASPEDRRDYPFIASTQVLPKYVDLIPLIDEVENQLQTNSCTANAGCTAMEIAYRRAGYKVEGKRVDFSRLFLYWNIRKLSGLTGDSGGYPRDIGKALKNHGVCYESFWDFIASMVNTEPSEASYKKAEPYKIHEYQRLGLSGNLHKEIKSALAMGMPVLATHWVTRDFGLLKGSWTTHSWGNPNSSRNGRHQVVIIGYDDDSSRYLAQNSWGKEWGDGGFFGIPYSHVGMDVEADLVHEFWVLNKLVVPYVPAGEEKHQIHPKPKKDKSKIAFITLFLGILLIIWLSSQGVI